MKRLVLFALALLILPDAAAQPRFDETIEVRFLEIDARVTDRDGNPVHGLGIADFVLYEDGRRIDIESAYEVRATPAAAAPRDVAVEPTPPLPASTRAKPRTIVFFLDQLPLNSGERGELFRDLAEFARTALREGDMVAVFGWALEARTILPLTRDHDAVVDLFARMGKDLDSIPGTMHFSVKQALVEAVAGAIADGGSSAGWSFDIEEERRQITGNCAEEMLAEMRRKGAAMKSIVSALQGDRAAAFVYVSNRMPENTAVYCSNLGRRSSGAGPVRSEWSTTSFLRDLGRTANAAGVTLYSLRPHVPKTMNDASESAPAEGSGAIRDSVYIANELLSLGVLAEATGGVVGYSPKEIKLALATIESDLDSYYSIAWRSTSDGRDRERNIRIETKDETLTVRARRTLVDKSDLTRTKETLVGNLHGVENPGDFVVSVRTTGERAKRKLRFVKTEVRFRPENLTFAERGKRRVATFRVLIVSSDELGALSAWTEMSHELVEPEDRTAPVSIEFELEMRPEGTRTAIGILDETTGVAGFAVLDTRASERQ